MPTMYVSTLCDLPFATSGTEESSLAIRTGRWTPHK